MRARPFVRVWARALAFFAVGACSSSDATSPTASQPQVTLTASVAQLTSRGEVVLRASVTDPGESVQKVEFYERIMGTDASPRKIGEDGAPPYEFTREIQGVADNGNREFTAKAYDAAQHVGTSNPVMVVVSLPADATTLKDTVSASHTSITTPGQIKFTVTLNKVVARIEVYNGDTKVAEVVPQAAPYVVSVPVTAANNGTQSYVVKAYDAAGTVLVTRTMEVVVDIRWDLVSTISDIPNYGDGLFGPFVATDADGSVYMGGTTVTGDVVRITKAFLIKHDPGGNRVWTRSFGGPNGQHAMSLGVDASHRVFIAGDVYSGVSIRENCYLSLYDASGAPIRTQLVNIAGWSKDSCVAASDAAGNFYVTGVVRDSATHHAEIFLVKYDKDGTAIWTRQFRSQPDTAGDIITGIAVDPLGGVYVTGYTNGSFGQTPATGTFDLFLLKYDSDGNRVWAHQLGQVGYITYGNQLASDPDGGVYVLGAIYNSQRNSWVLVLRVAPDGAMRWSRVFGSNWTDYPEGIAVDRRGVYVVGGTRGGSTTPGIPPSGELKEASQGGVDAFLAKLSLDGTVLSARLLGSPEHDALAGVAVGANGALYVTGIFGGFETMGKPILARDPNVTP